MEKADRYIDEEYKEIDYSKTPTKREKWKLKHKKKWRNAMAKRRLEKCKTTTQSLQMQWR